MRGTTVSNQPEPTEAEIAAYRTERLRAYLAEDWNEALAELDTDERRAYGHLMQKLCLQEPASREAAQSFADQLALVIQQRMLTYWKRIVERDLQEWIADYPARAAITAGEREFEERREQA